MSSNVRVCPWLSSEPLVWPKQRLTVGRRPLILVAFEKKVASGDGRCGDAECCGRVRGRKRRLVRRSASARNLCFFSRPKSLFLLGENGGNLARRAFSSPVLVGF